MNIFALSMITHKPLLSDRGGMTCIKIESVIYMYIMILYCLHTLPMTCELHTSFAIDQI